VKLWELRAWCEKVAKEVLYTGSGLAMNLAQGIQAGSTTISWVNRVRRQDPLRMVTLH